MYLLLACGFNIYYYLGPYSKLLLSCETYISKKIHVLEFQLLIIPFDTLLQPFSAEPFEFDVLWNGYFITLTTAFYKH